MEKICCTENNNVKIGEEIKDFSLDIYLNEKITKTKLSNYRGQWLVLFFYPADFTFVCPTELQELANNYENFQKLNTEIISISTDTAYAHKAWHDSSPTIKIINYPMGADPNGKISQNFGVYIEEEGLALRGTFIIDPEGKLVAYEVNDNSIGRNASELIRKLQAAQFIREHNGEVCPASWKPGEKTIKPDINLVGKI